MNRMSRLFGDRERQTYRQIGTQSSEEDVCVIDAPPSYHVKQSVQQIWRKLKSKETHAPSTVGDKSEKGSQRAGKAER